MKRFWKPMLNQALAAVMAVCLFAGAASPGFSAQAVEEDKGLSGKCDGLDVAVGDIPEGLAGAASVSVEKLPADRVSDYQEALDGKGGGYEALNAYRISLLDESGKEIESADKIRVTLTGEDVVSAIGSGDIAVFYNTVLTDGAEADQEENTVQETAENLSETVGGQVTDPADAKNLMGGGKTDTTPSVDDADGGEKIADLIGTGSGDTQNSGSDGDLDSVEAADQSDATESETIQVDADAIEELETEIEESSATFTAGCKFECVIAKKVGESTEDTAPMSISVREAEDIITTGNDITENDTMKKVEIGENQIFEMDKYLSEPAGKINGQDAYNLYLEQAVEDTGKATKITNPAPGQKKIVMIIDQSNSMRPESRIENVNNALEQFFNTVKELNDRRMEYAKQGLYSDIDPKNGLKEQMKNHLMELTAVVGYNSSAFERYNGISSGGIVLDSGENVTKALDKTRVSKNDFSMMTRTDLGMSKVKEMLSDVANLSDYYIILLTDGLPNRLDTDGWHQLYDKDGYETANASLCVARALKDKGATIDAVYLGANVEEEISVAMQSGNIKDINYESDPYIRMPVFLSLLSSDYPKNRHIDADFTLNYESVKGDGFGKHIGFARTNDNWADYLSSIAPKVDTANEKRGGYASSDALVQDTISQPFEITAGKSVLVYKVPRIPANLDESGKPADMGDGHLVSNFRWGRDYYEEDGEEKSEWIDITSEVSCSVSGQVIKVTGFDYEENALTVYDKDTVRSWNGNDENALIYHPGDYGYKLVVVVPINAKTTFGGNHIKTNNPEGSKFYPSVPGGGLPEWKENGSYNPEHHDFIKEYPIPAVDLKITYDIVCDDMVVYAPQTAKIHNLVTDAENSLWYTAPDYPILKSVADNAKQELDAAEKEYDEYEKAYLSSDIPDSNSDSSESDESRKLAELEEAKFEKTGAYQEALENLSTVACYIPNGVNNQFVNIEYKLSDPGGQEIATMSIPHGKAYNGDIDWTITPGSDAIITESGIYTISATVTPVETQASPNGLVYSSVDSQAVKDSIKYFSESYSSTGSSSTGSQSAKTITKSPTAYLYQLRIKAVDSRLTPNQTLDFIVSGVEKLMETDNPHIFSYEWVCTDGQTPSKSDNEPGITEELAVGEEVSIVSQIPDRAVTEGLSKQISGTWAATSPEGEYIPVSVILSRKVGSLNKGENASSLQEQYMKDDDNIWGDKDSVIWQHECGIITDYNCEEENFADAQEYNTSEDASGKGKVRYLIHVMANPMPDIEKSTSTPVITAGSDIHWSVVAKNDDEKQNGNHRASEFSLVDILPYNGDRREDVVVGHESSKFSGTLMYKTVIADYTKAPSALEAFKAGKIALYYTVETDVRTAEDVQILGNGAVKNITWTRADASITDNAAAFSIPTDAVAVKLDATLAWDESVALNMTANLTDPSQQKTGDYYHNQAFVLNGNGKNESKVVTTQVSPLFISGTIWEDSDSNALMMQDETKLPGIVMTLYTPFDSKNGGKPDRTINGIQLSLAYDINGNRVRTYLTGDDGTYSFEDIPSGTYYVVADHIPEYYKMVKKQAGNGDQETAKLGSKAEESFIASTEQEANSAWIKEIKVVNQGVTNQNFGVETVRGTVKIYKTLDEVYYPNTMTDEEKEDYRVSFLFQLTNKDTRETYANVVYLDADTIRGGDGTATVYCTFTDIPLGTYTLTELSKANYSIKNVTGTSGAVTFNPGTKEAEITITSSMNEVRVDVENKLNRDPPGGDENGVTNHVNMRIPVRLEIFYTGQDPISSTTLTNHKFQKSDFSDMIVTYDDGSQISLKDGTLQFEQVTLSPDTVTNLMNTGDGKITISGYYAERGHLVMDSFRVGVALKPVHKFYINFNSNGSFFDNRQTTNAVRFGYDENAGSNNIISGTYKDVDNEGMNTLSGFTFAGWNTSPDGTGVQYDGLSALNTVGKQSNVTSLTLYANWRTNVTFNANGGTISGGTTADERALAWQASGAIPASKNQKISTTLTATKEGMIFVAWNTKQDGTGADIGNYGAINGPVTFYAIYYNPEYGCTGSAQTFTAPVSGYYELQLWGALGATDQNTSPSQGGGYTKAEVFLKAGETVYVIVGENGTNGVNKSAYNGGGDSKDWATGKYAAGGGGATHVATTSKQLYEYGTAAEAEKFVIAVAGGAGGLADNGKDGGAGGGETGANGPGDLRYSGAGGTQTTGYKFGKGEPAIKEGAGGGGGWYGGYAASRKGGKGYGGGGGSGHIGSIKNIKNASTTQNKKHSTNQGHVTITLKYKQNQP